jgi:L-iditol 2-dehydrogenase
MNTMKALVKDKDTVLVREMPSPTLQSDHEVIIQVERAGLCRTDVYVAEGRIAAPDPLILGHEFAGVIRVLGDQVTTLRVGDRVTVNPMLACGLCPTCLAGNALSCQHSRFLGVHQHGAFAEYIAVPAMAVYPLPDGVTFTQGAYTEPVAASLAVLKAGIEAHEKGLIYGDNRIAHLTKQILDVYGFADVTVCDATTAVLPADTYDFIIETLATTETLEEIIRAIRPLGKIILKSRQYQPVSLILSDLIKKEPVFHAVNYGSFETSLDLIADRRLKVDGLMGEVFQLEEFAEVFARSKNSESLKLFFAPGEG